MQRSEWLKEMQHKSETLYDQFAPRYWVEFGLYPNQTHQAFLSKFLGRLDPNNRVLSAACGAGRYDGFLLEAGHQVVGIDQSEGMLARAREHFPAAEYHKLALQEMAFQGEFHGAICIDALEHVPPEDWPGILRRFRQALVTGGHLYFTVEGAEEAEVAAAYQRAKDQGLPVVHGELVDGFEAAYQAVIALGDAPLPDEVADKAVYHFCPSREQVAAWLEGAGFEVVEVGEGDWYWHYLVMRD
jgi:SAM-dependent methyltransferase